MLGPQSIINVCVRVCACRFDAGSPGHSSVSPPTHIEEEVTEEGKGREGKVTSPKDGKIAKAK